MEENINEKLDGILSKLNELETKVDSLFGNVKAVLGLIYDQEQDVKDEIYEAAITVTHPTEESFTDLEKKTSDPNKMVEMLEFLDWK